MTDIIKTAARRLAELGIEYEKNAPLAPRTSFRIGGPADLSVFPSDAPQFAAAFGILKDEGVPCVTVGRGTNLLFSDEGLRGAALFTTAIDFCRASGSVLEAGAGCRMATAASRALDASLTGFEFAHGIPGSVGGGVVMNAGAYGGQISDVLTSMTLFDSETGIVFDAGPGFASMTYRHTLFQDDKRYSVLSATFGLSEGDPEQIAERMRELQAKRRTSQPLEFPSAGSVFKRPAPDMYVGKMIEESGLKGTRIGGAEVSLKHAGFIVNCGGATCRDVLSLIELVREKLFENYGVRPEVEIRVVPCEPDKG